MRAILFALANPSALEPLSEHLPPCLFGIGDRPMLVQVIEALVKRGVTRVDLVLHEHPEQVRVAVGDGSRWGVEVTTHLVKNPSNPFVSIRAAATDWDDKYVLIGCAESLPALPVELGTEATLYVQNNSSWTGWSLIRRETLTQVPPDLHYDGLPGILPGQPRQVVVPTLLDCRSFDDWMAANHHVLNCTEEQTFFPATARLDAPGVWISQGAEVDPSARLHAPVFIGKNSRVGPNCEIGPNVVVENHCLIDQGTHIADCIVCHDSYVGESLTLRKSIINRNLLLNLEHDTTIEISDEFILSALSPASPTRGAWWLVERCVAAIMLFALSPLFLYQLLTRQLHREPVADLPGDGSQTIDWLSFSSQLQTQAAAPLWSQLPALYHIMRGQAHFVGVQPRTAESVAKLPADWRKLYTNAKLGWLTLAHLHEGHLTVDDVYSSEAYYAAHASPWFDFKCYLRYARKLLRA